METSNAKFKQRDQLVLTHLSLADAIASRMYGRYSNLLERDDLIQVARLELVRAAGRVIGDQPVSYLRQCISGALLHHLRDKALLVRRPKSARCETPWSHVSLDAVTPSGSTALEQLAAPEPDDSQFPGFDPALLALVEQLPAAQAACLRLTILEGLSLRQAALQLGISTMTVSRAQKKALATLREQVAA